MKFEGYIDYQRREFCKTSPAHPGAVGGCPTKFEGIRSDSRHLPE